MSARVNLRGGAREMEVGRGCSHSLRALLEGVVEVEVEVGAEQEIQVRGLSMDSRVTRAGDLFFAVPGEREDGRGYIAEAVARGAVAVVREGGDLHDRDDNGGGEGVPSFAVADLRGEISGIAARFFGHPSAKMRVVGVTGTNGKTSCAYLLAQALEALGERCAVLSTVGNGFVGELAPASLTTGDAISAQRMLAELQATKPEGAAAVCVEVSSHGLEQRRLDGVAFDVAVFTNLSHDHLDYHGDLRSYARAKRRLFEFAGLDCAVINADDEFGRVLLGEHRAARGLSYGVLSEDADVRARDIRCDAGGIAFDAHFGGEVARVRSGLLGEVNVGNLLACVAALLASGYGLAEVALGAEGWRAPPGRMEVVGGKGLPSVVVDYAHTPAALENALQSLAAVCEGEVWAIFGCGGERDVEKRARMGEIAERCAAHVVVTDDNPRGEEPAQITREIVRGMQKPARVIHSRARALEYALGRAGAGDMILLAGKGHEGTQAIGGRVVEVNDRELAEAALGKLRKLRKKRKGVGK